MIVQFGLSIRHAFHARLPQGTLISVSGSPSTIQFHAVSIFEDAVGRQKFECTPRDLGTIFCLFEAAGFCARAKYNLGIQIGWMLNHRALLTRQLCNNLGYRAPALKCQVSNVLFDHVVLIGCLLTLR